MAWVIYTFCGTSVPHGERQPSLAPKCHLSFCLSFPLVVSHNIALEQARLVAQRRKDIITLRESLEAQAARLGSQDPKQDAGRVLCRAARPRVSEALHLLEERLIAVRDDALSLRGVTESDAVLRRKLLAERAPLR
jgi:hypothetical protein